MRSRSRRRARTSSWSLPRPRCARRSRRSATTSSAPTRASRSRSTSRARRSCARSSSTARRSTSSRRRISSHMDELVRAQARRQAPVVFARNEPVIVVAKEQAGAVRAFADLPAANRIVIGTAGGADRSLHAADPRPRGAEPRRRLSRARGGEGRLARAQRAASPRQGELSARPTPASSTGPTRSTAEDRVTRRDHPAGPQRHRRVSDRCGRGRSASRARARVGSSCVLSPDGQQALQRAASSLPRAALASP